MHVDLNMHATEVRVRQDMVGQLKSRREFETVSKFQWHKFSVLSTSLC